MIVHGNYVIVRPEPTIVMSQGFVIPGREERRWSPFGTVVAIPDRLRFIPHVGQKRHDQWASKYSLEVDTDLEVDVGDRVVFRYNAHMDVHEGVVDRDLYHDDYDLIMPYDALYGRADGATWYPLNGMVFVTPEGPGRGVISCLGQPVRAYQQYPNLSDGDNLSIGDHVIYNPRRGVRMEVEEFDQELGGMVRMYRKEILLIK